MRYDLYDLSRVTTNIPGSLVAWLMADAASAARFPPLSEHHCQFGPSRDPFIRACRITWRVTFRTSRQIRQGRAAQADDGPIWPEGRAA